MITIIFGMTIAELLTLFGVLLTFFSGILFINIKLTKIETKVKGIEDRENRNDSITIETAKVLKESTIETAKLLKDSTTEIARLLAIRTDKEDENIEKRITSIDEKVNTILSKLL